VDGQPQNDKEVISEVLPEISADDDSVVDQFKQHAPVCKANDVILEVLPEVNSKLSEKREIGEFLNEADKKRLQHSKLSRNKKIVTIGNDQDLKLSLSTDNYITCTYSKNAETSGLIAIQLLDRNQVTEQILKCDLSRPISSVALVKLHNESILNNAIKGFT
ncbi:9423_t:CDS:2, partial [Funneliformis mosseae]